MSSAKLKTLKRHGTKYGYNKGCRCDECRDVAKASKRAWRARARAENHPSYRHELADNKARKESYRGTCIDCGAATTGCDGPSSTRQRCYICSNRITGLGRRGTGRMIQQLLVVLADGPLRSIEIRDRLDLYDGYTSNLLHRALKYGFVERVSRGVYRAADKSKDAA